MPKTSTHEHDDGDKNAAFRSSRRQSQATRARRNQPRHNSKQAGARPGRQKHRNISVRAELREKPDVRKIARAVIQHALAEAERESQRIAAMEVASQSRNRVEGDHA